jgi:hypothetical protein
MTINCPSCGAPAMLGEAYCDACGYDFRSAPQPSNPLPIYQPPIPTTTPPIPQAVPPPVARAASAHLVVQGFPDILSLSSTSAEVVVGREDAISGVFPGINLEPYGAQDAGVSRKHIMLRWSGSNWEVEDLNSVNGAFLSRRRLPAGQPAPLTHGDELRLGKLALNFYLD